MSEPDSGPAPAFPGLTLEATAFTRQQLIYPQAPQLALAGRSNVGKSSLINALAGRKALAKVSATPGKTRSVNYYRLGGGEAFLVDLPGYGYAKCSQAEREKWAALLERYLRETPGLKALILLLDSRLPPQAADRDLLAFAASLSLPVLALLTKSDKCGKRELQRCANAWGALLVRGVPLAVSARSGRGVPELWAEILRRLEL